MDIIKQLEEWVKDVKVYLADEKPVKFEKAELEDGTMVSFESLEVPKPIMKIVVAEDKTETEEPLGDDTYIINGKNVTVKDGLISEVTDVEAKVEAGVEDVFNIEKLKTKIDFKKEGFHTITLSVANGKIEWGNLYSESIQELKFEKNDLLKDLKLKHEKEIKDLKNKFKEDVVKLSKITEKKTALIQGPVTEVKPITKMEFIINQLNKKKKENIY